MGKLCKSRKVVNSKVNPKRWFYGLEHCRKADYVAIPALETYLPLNLMKEDYTELLGYVWFTNAGADPAPVGLTLLATVDAAGAADEAALMADIKVQLEASIYAGLMQIDVQVDGVEIFNNFIGLITAESGDTSGAAVVIEQQSFGGALGLLSEDGASAAFEFETLDQKADSTGNANVESFLINVLATITLSITDTSKEKFEELFIKPLGGEHVEGLEKLIGFGTGNFFQSLISKAGKLVGHDSAAAFTDRSNDWQMLAGPKPSSINFNKELQIIECEFTSYYDATMPEEINIFSIGDKSIIDLAAL